MRVVRASAQDKQAGQEANIAEKLHKCLMLPRSCTSVCSLPTETKGQARAHGARQWQPHPGPAPLLAAAERIERGGAGRGGAGVFAFAGTGEWQSVGGKHVLVGHSERRSVFKYTDEMINGMVRRPAAASHKRRGRAWSVAPPPPAAALSAPPPPSPPDIRRPAAARTARS